MSEDTLEAFSNAITQGADGVEMDLRISKDGEVVIVHDPNLHRISGTALKVEHLTVDELKALPLRYGGCIPTLNEVTAHIHAPSILDLEIKHKAVIRPLITKLKTSASLRERTLISSFNHSILKVVKDEVPDARVIILQSRWHLPLRSAQWYSKLEKLAPFAVAFPFPVLNKRRVEILQQKGFKVGAWDYGPYIPRDAKRLVTLGLDIAIVRWIEKLRAELGA